MIFLYFVSVLYLHFVLFVVYYFFNLIIVIISYNFVFLGLFWQRVNCIICLLLFVYILLLIIVNIS